MHAVIFVYVCGEYPSAARARASACVCVCFTVLMMEPVLCRQPVLILWSPPQLQRVGNKPFSSNLQTVQQSMGNYLSQSMLRPFSFCLSLLPSSYLYPFLLTTPPSPPPVLFSPSLLSHFCCLSVFSTHSFAPLPPSPLSSLFFFLTCFSLQLSQIRSTYFEMRRLSSSRAINESRLSHMEYVTLLD